MGNDIIDEGMVTARFEEKTNKVKYDNYLMPFGKYVGHYLSDIFLEDNDYFTWFYGRAQGELKEAMTHILKTTCNARKGGKHNV